MQVINLKSKSFYGKLIKLFFVSAIFSLFLILVGFFAIDSPTAQGQSSDAIGFRVIPNTASSSPLRWYNENVKLKGSPQALTVDGYEAVRDGRTVYVNAANLADTNSDGNLDTFYTNIYIISYSQQAEEKTVDIFGSILENWKFNKNLTQKGTCNITQTADLRCLYDSECPKGEYCLSQKAKAIRDTKRLADLSDIKLALSNYQISHNAYPPLASGSYLSGISISTWPSWRASLGTALGITMPLDPVNKLEACPGFDALTCWNQNTKTFKFGDVGWVNLLNSRAYMYQYFGNTNKYRLCAAIESPYANLANDNCAFTDPSATEPVIECGVTTARSNAPFSGSVKITGRTYDSVTVEAVAPNSWAVWDDPNNPDDWQWNPGTTGLKINNTADKTIKIITAARTPTSAMPPYTYRVTVSYNNSANTVIEDCSIRVACVLSCPLASEICVGITDQRPNGCGGTCNVIGTKTGSIWGPNPNTLDPNTVCNTQTYPEINDCGVIRNTSFGARCCPTCTAASEPNCRASAPANSEAGNGACCGGQSCFKCRENYSWNGANCVADSRCYACADKPLIGTVWNLVGAYTQTWNGSAWVPPDDPTAEYNTAASTFSCRYECANSFGWSGAVCLANNSDGLCSDLPANAQWNDSTNPGHFTRTLQGNLWLPNSLTSYYYETEGDCHYTCVQDYFFNINACVPNTQQEACGPLPDHTVANGSRTFRQEWQGSSWEPGAMASHWDPALDECHFTCANNFNWNQAMGQCVGATRLGNCGGSIPQNADANALIDQYDQTWDGDSWEPVIDWTHNDTPGTCTFECINGYGWDGVNSCLPAPVVSITSPWNGMDLGYNIGTTIQANASDADGAVVSVQFFVNGAIVGTDNNGADGWSVSWTPTTLGANLIYARATDNMGLTTNSATINGNVKYVLTIYVGPYIAGESTEVRYSTGDDSCVSEPTSPYVTCTTYHNPGTVVVLETYEWRTGGDQINLNWGYCPDIDWGQCTYIMNGNKIEQVPD